MKGGRRTQKVKHLSSAVLAGGGIKGYSNYGEEGWGGDLAETEQCPLVPKWE